MIDKGAIVISIWSGLSAGFYTVAAPQEMESVNIVLPLESGPVQAQELVPLFEVREITLDDITTGPAGRYQHASVSDWSNY